MYERNGGKMFGTESNHFQVVKDALEGKRAADEETFASFTILSERLERIKKLDRAFNSIAFSSAVRKLTEQKSSVAAY